MDDVPRHRDERRYEDEGPEQRGQLKSDDGKAFFVAVSGMVGIYWGVGRLLDSSASTRLRVLGAAAVVWSVVVYASYVLRFTTPLRALWWTRRPTRRLVRLVLPQAWWTPLAIGLGVYVGSRLN